MIDQPPTPPSSNRRAFGCLLEIVETVVLTLILFWVIQSFVAQPFQVQQFSMQNTIQDRQFVLVDRLTPRFDRYHRGDIVVFTPPANAESPDQKPFIKRVIGIAGDRVEIRDGNVYINGIKLDEPYLYAVDGTAQPTVANGDVASWTVEPGKLFVMGDHRARSSDSRVFGTINVTSVIGRAWLRYWPLETSEYCRPPSTPSSRAQHRALRRGRPQGLRRARRRPPKPTKRPTPTPHR